MSVEIYQHSFANGLTLLVEQMPHVRSAAFNFLIPAGCVHDPPEQLGLANLLSDLITRGAGKRSSKELTLALDELGLDRDESSGTLHLRIWGSTLAKNLVPALGLYADIVRRPLLPEEELPPVQDLALLELEGLEDEPRQKVMVEVKKRYFPPPLGRDRRGTPEGIQRTTIEAIRQFHQRMVQPRQSILSIAGNVEWKQILDAVEQLYGDWQPQPPVTYSLEAPLPSRDHLTKETKQTQIGIAYDSVPITHPDYYAAIAAVNVLSGGMSSRLFTEVREKRGLCYAVWASYQTMKDRACVIGYAGTTNERAQETLDVLLSVIDQLKEGVTEDEVQRMKAGLKSSLIMQEESTSARAGSMASDWYFLGRIRSFDEIQAAIDGLTADRIVEHVRAFPPRSLTLVTLGPKPLTLDA